MAERKLSGVRVSLPRLTRVRAVSHDAYSGATLTYDDERRDYELCKLESVPGVPPAMFRGPEVLPADLAVWLASHFKFQFQGICPGCFSPPNSKFPPNFERLILGCIDADFCK